MSRRLLPLRLTARAIAVAAVAAGAACSADSPGTPTAVAATPTPAPVKSLAVFGAERRASVATVGDTTVIGCAAGSQPAGVRYAEWTWATAGPELAFEYRANAAFAVGVAPTAGAAATVSDSLFARRYAARVALGADSALARLTVTISCPATAGQLRLTRFDRAAASRPLMRGAWWWAATQWRDSADAVFAAAGRVHLSSLFVGPPRTDDGGADAAAFGRFVAAAGARGLGVWIVLGDPTYVQSAGRQSMRTLLRWVTAYQAAAAPASRIAGVQLDIEPYLLPTWDSQSTALLSAYATTLRDAQAEWAGALDVVIPFWYAEARYWNTVGATLTGLTGVSATVMDYHTDPAELRKFASFFLDWADIAQRRVTISLELGMGPAPVAPWADDLSYRGDWGALLAAAAALGGDLAQRRSFGGIAINGVDDPRVTPAPACGPCVAAP